MMKKIFILSFLTVCASQLVAQESSWEFGVSLYGNVSQNIIISEAGFEDMGERYEDFERAKPSVGINAFAAFPLNEKLFLQFGLGYLNYGEQSRKFADNEFSFPNEIDDFYGFVQPTEYSGDNAPIRRIYYNYHSIEIPVQLKWFFAEKWFVLGGASALINVGQSTTIYRQPENALPELSTHNSGYTNMNTMNMAVNAGVAYTFCQGKKTDWFVGVNGQHILFPVAENTSINRKYISGGVTVGMIF